MTRLSVHVARTFRDRLIGWMGRRSIGADEALLFPHCRSVHTFGMRVPIDVVMVDAEQRVLAVHVAIRPWRIVRGPSGSVAVIEMAAGAVAAFGIVFGEIIQWNPHSEKKL